MQEVNSIVIAKTMQSSLSPSLVFPDLQVKYPDVVTQALCELYEESNSQFKELVNRNREWDTDYQYCFKSDSPLNWIVQIDMCGLDYKLLQKLSTLNIQSVKEILRDRIFEIENSWAVYQILNRVGEKNGVQSFYSIQTNKMMHSIRNEFKKPIALLAITQQKYDGMRATEFGKKQGEDLSKSEIFDLSGFDEFFGPKEFKDHLEKNSGVCEYLLYVRASDPIEKLKKPDTSVLHPLLEDEEIRRIIKMNTLTFNIDNPNWPLWDKKRINDTKWYMPEMNMAFPVCNMEDLKSDEFAYFLYKKGFGLQDLISDSVMIRAKPAQGTFGCYGHIRGSLLDNKFRAELKNSLQARGPYMLQIEQKAPEILHLQTNQEYAFIDRLFCGMIDGKASWMGGHREFLPCNSQEVKNGRLHGNKDAVFGEIM